MKIRNLFAAALVAALAAGPAAADDVKDIKTAARAAVEKTGKAVLTVKAVVKIKTGQGDRDQKLEIVGTVVDPSGLTIVSASAIEPASLMNQMRGGGGRRGGGGGGGEGMPRIESEVTETLLVLGDGTEVEADVVLKDADLDVAFIKPREAQKLDAVTLKSRGRAPELLEDIFTVSRLGRAENRATAVQIGTIKAVVKGPKTFYVTTGELSNASRGCLAFGADGTTLGIFVVKIGDSGEGRRGGEASIVLRPIEDILELAKQAKDAKAPEKKAAPAAEEKPATEEKKPSASGEEKPAEKKPAPEAPAAPQ